jgi:cysteine desulfurase
VTEHRAVLDVCGELEEQGCAVTYLPVEADGRVDPARVEAAIRPETVLVSIMLANNEIGVLQPVAEIAGLCRRHGVLMHSDAAQALGLIDCHLAALPVDLMSFSAHKIYGPKGIGALYVRRRRPRVRLKARQFGGGHEGGRRSGTLDVPSIVGFAAACILVAGEREADARRLGFLRDRLLASLLEAFPGLIVNGSLEHRLAGNLNVCLPGINAERLLAEVSGVALSNGSACTSSGGVGSHVLAALPGGRERADRALRFGLGRGTTEAEIEAAVSEIVRAASVLGQQPPRVMDGLCAMPACEAL